MGTGSRRLALALRGPVGQRCGRRLGRPRWTARGHTRRRYRHPRGPCRGRRDGRFQPPRARPRWIRNAIGLPWLVPHQVRWAEPHGPDLGRDALSQNAPEVGVNSGLRGRHTPDVALADVGDADDVREGSMPAAGRDGAGHRLASGRVGTAVARRLRLAGAAGRASPLRDFAAHLSTRRPTSRGRCRLPQFVARSRFSRGTHSRCPLHSRRPRRQRRPCRATGLDHIGQLNARAMRGDVGDNASLAGGVRGMARGPAEVPRGGHRVSYCSTAPSVIRTSPRSRRACSIARTRPPVIRTLLPGEVQDMLGAIGCPDRQLVVINMRERPATASE